MAKIIHIDFTQEAKPSTVIDIATVQQSCRKLKAGLIAPAAEEVHTDLAVEHSAEPIKSMDDIIRISQFLIDKSGSEIICCSLLVSTLDFVSVTSVYFGSLTSSTMIALSVTVFLFWRRRRETPASVSATAISLSTQQL